MHRRGHLRVREPGAHELEHDDLREGVLQGHAVGIEIGVASAALDAVERECRRQGVAQVVHEDLLGERQRAPEALPGEGGAARKAGVQGLDELDRRGCG